ncbi:MAG: peptide chain release factor N(5)-glutamine methyltransferase [Pseudomonadota bacterium]
MSRAVARGEAVSWDRAIRTAAARLDAAGIDGAARDARLLAAFVAGVDTTALRAHGDRVMSEDQQRRLDEAVVARAARRPLSHITGCRLFWGRSFQVSAAVLDPRPETETLVAEALALCQRATPGVTLLELGVGSGCILLTLLAELPAARGTGTDLSAEALTVAAANAAALDLTGRVALVQGRWFEPVPGKADILLSNPPYVPASAWAGLAPEVRDHEPVAALVPEPDPMGDGLAAYREILSGARAHLNPGGAILLEFGAGQGKAVSQIAADAGFQARRLIPDLDGRERVLIAYSPE